MDFKESLNASIIPTVALVVIEIIQVVLGLVLQGILGLILCLVGAIMLLVSLIIYLWAGYNSVKKFKLDVAGAALTGAIIGFISGSINAVIDIILRLLNLNNAVGTANLMGLGGAAAVGFTLLVCLFSVIGVILTTIVGAVLAAIGGLIAEKA
jgi:hypothetical protein